MPPEWLTSSVQRWCVLDDLGDLTLMAELCQGHTAQRDRHPELLDRRVGLARLAQAAWPPGRRSTTSGRSAARCRPRRAGRRPSPRPASRQSRRPRRPRPSPATARPIAPPSRPAARPACGAAAAPAGRRSGSLAHHGHAAIARDQRLAGHRVIAEPPLPAAAAAPGRRRRPAIEHGRHPAACRTRTASAPAAATTTPPTWARDSRSSPQARRISKVNTGPQASSTELEKAVDQDTNGWPAPDAGPGRAVPGVAGPASRRTAGSVRLGRCARAAARRRTAASRVSAGTEKPQAG